MREKGIWEKFLNKEVTVIKTAGDRQLFYKGIVDEVLEDKIILFDRKLGSIPLTFDGLSLLESGGVE